jgi:hypothetical protein
MSLQGELGAVCEYAQPNKNPLRFRFPLLYYRYSYNFAKTSRRAPQSLNILLPNFHKIPSILCILEFNFQL